MTDFVGGSGNDSFLGGSGDDTFLNGGGRDTLQGAGGNDTFTINVQPANSSIIDGGADSDTLVIQNLAGAPTSASVIFPAGISSSTTSFIFTSLTGFEQLQFNSTAGTSVGVTLTFGGSGAPFNPGQIGTGLASNATITGGAGWDSILLVAIYNTPASPSYTLTAPTFTYVNWTTPDRAYQPGDRVTILQNGNSPGTINGAAHSGVMNLIGGFGSDTINGSDDMDFLAVVNPSFQGGNLLADYGINELHGGGGNDVLALSNVYVQYLSGGNPVNTAPTFMTGAGSTFDGGDGTDFLLLGGDIYFAGTLTSIEGIYLAPAYTNTNASLFNNAPLSQHATHAAIDGSTIAAMPANLILDGSGTLQINLGGDVDYDFSGFVFDPGSDVLVRIDASDENTSQTIIGTSHDDLFNFGAGDATVTGGSGADRYQFDEMGGSLTTQHNAVIADFVIGEDKIDLDETGLINFGRLADFLSQGPDGALFHVETGGQTFNITIQGVDLADLSESDFLLDQSNDTQFPHFETGTAFGDILLGGAFADSLVGGDGNDTIYTGGGADTIQGGNDDDTVIFDGPVPTFVLGVPYDIGSYDGGAGFDTMVLRDSGLSNVNPQGIPVSGHPLTEFSAVTNFEEIRFESEAGRAMSVFFLYFIGSNPANGTILNLTSPIPANITGGEGQDFEVLIAVNGMGSLSELLLPTLNMNSWTGATKTYLNDGDYVVLQANDGASPYNYTLRANDTNGSNGMVQHLLSGNGDDTLTGSTGQDWLEARGGNNMVDGGAGDDAIAIINMAPSTTGTPVPTTYDGAGSTYEGGAGNDFLVIGGEVNFAGTLSGIEGIYLQPEYVLNNGYGSQARAQLTISATELAKLGTNARFDGVGDVIVNLQPGESLDTSGYVFEAGSDVTLMVNGLALNGGAGNDSLLGTGADDTITTGGGRDTVSALGGDDTVTLNGPVTGGSSISGGAGTDTLVVQNLPGDPTQASYLAPGGRVVSVTNVIGSSFSGFETVEFRSDANTNLQLLNVAGQFAGGITLMGGDGQDTLLTIISPSISPPVYTFNAPVYAYSNWDTPARGYQIGDTVAFFIQGSANGTINGSEHSGVQALLGGAGNDTIFGTSGVDLLAGGAGNNELHGGGGNDALSLMNNYQVINNNGTILTTAETTFTGAGSLFDGGGGQDFIMFGGNVNFQGTLQSIEGIYLAPGFSNPAPTQNGQTLQQKYTWLTIDNSIFQTLPAALEVDGVGTIQVEIDPGTSFNGSQIVFTSGADVKFFLEGGTGNDIITGTSGDDTFEGGDGSDFLTGGAGVDAFRLSYGNDYVSDFTLGEDKIDLSQLNFTSFEQVLPFLNQSLADVVLTYTFNGMANTMRFKDVNLADLGADDFLFAAPGSLLDLEPTENADVLLGGSGNDAISALGGNDTIQTGGGLDTIDAGNGDDTVIITAPPADGSIFDGGIGTDTLVLRTSAAVTIPDVGPQILTQTTTTTNFEKLKFDTDAGTQNIALFNYGQLDGISTIEGGAGNDLVAINTGDSGSFTLQAFTTTNFSVGSDAILLGNTNAIGSLNLGVTDHVSNYVAVLQGGTQGDTLTGSNGTDALLGNGGDDSLLGADGNDTLNGGAGNDYLDGGAGADSMLGGTGNDTYVIASASDQIVELSGEGIDTVKSVSFSTINAASYGEVENISYEGAGNATLYGNDLDNTITGSSGNDQLYGGIGNDVLNGFSGADTMNGGVGNDYFYLDDLGDRISEAANEGNDTAEVTFGNFDLLSYVNVENLITTFASGANLRGNYSANAITGGAGNDTIDGLAGADTLNGGDGDDTYTVDNAADVIIDSSGIDTVVAKVAWTLGTGQDRLVMQYVGIGTGNDDANTITGGGGSDSILGMGGDDILIGGIGADTLNGGTGADTMQGGTGGDIYIVDNFGDVVDETGGNGSDTVQTTLASYTLATDIERLAFTGSGNFAGTGNGLANFITGGAGNDTLDGSTGADTLNGGAGNDTYIVDISTDYITDSSGIDTVQTTAGSLTLTSGLENLTYTGSGNFTGSGNGLANFITGGAGNDSLNGSSGNDTLVGNVGNDTLLGGEGNDSISGNSGADVITGGQGKDTLSGGADADTFRYVTTLDTRTGTTTDTISDFLSGTDKIDVSAIDPNGALAGDQAYTFIGTSAFSAVAGVAEVRYVNSGGNTFVHFDNDGNGTTDMTILLAGSMALSGGDFIL